MDGKNGAQIFRPVSENVLANQIRVEIQRAGIDVDENWSRACAHDGTCRSKKAEWGSNDRIARLYASSDQRQPEGFGSGGATDGVSRSGEGCNLALERLNFRAENEVLRIANARNGGQDLVANAVILAMQVEKGNGFRRGASRRLTGSRKRRCHKSKILAGAVGENLWRAMPVAVRHRTVLDWRSLIRGRGGGAWLLDFAGPVG